MLTTRPRCHILLSVLSFDNFIFVILGFVLEGFHAMGPSAEEFDLSGPADIISEIVVSFHYFLLF